MPSVNLGLQRSDLEGRSDEAFVQVVMGVSANGETFYNTIWRSEPGMMRVDIRWQDSYAITWLDSRPERGMQLMFSNDWTPVGLGETFDLNEDGQFQKSNKPGPNDAVSVGANKSSREAYIVLGARSERGGFEPCFVWPRGLQQGAGASFKPLNEVKWWIDEQPMSGSYLDARPDARTARAG